MELGCDSVTQESIISDVSLSAHGDRNEDTTRLHLIDTLLFDCLGWSKSDCLTELSYDGDYADYTFSAPRPTLIVEAKREGKTFEIPIGATKNDYSLKSILRDNPDLNDAARQVATYCQTRGIPYAVVANGHQIMAFIAISSDGPPMDGRALVFNSLENMLENFLTLWNNISKPAVQSKNIESTLLRKQSRPILAKLSNSILNYPGTKMRNEFQTELQTVSEFVIEDVTRADQIEQQFLEECYCESGALTEYSMLSRGILKARYSAIFSSDSPGPQTAPVYDKKGVSSDLLSASLSKRPILLLGDVGVGKTIFLRHLMKIYAAEQFKNSITIHINLGIKGTLDGSINNFVIKEIERILNDEYGIDIYESVFIKDMYRGELLRFSRGIYGALKEADPKLYSLKELEFLESKKMIKLNT